MTYSLTLRENINRRLTIQEMDDNFLYLQDLAMSGGNTNLPLNEIVIGGSASGLTSSPNFCYNNSNRSSILGGRNNINISVDSFIGNSFYSTICDNSNLSSIIGGYYSSVINSKYSTIIGSGNCNVNSCNSKNLSSNGVIIDSNFSSILGGNSNHINNSCNSTIIGGHNLCINDTDYSTKTSNLILQQKISPLPYPPTQTSFSGSGPNDATMSGVFTRNSYVDYTATISDVGRYGFYINESYFSIIQGDILVGELSGATASLHSFWTSDKYVITYEYNSLPVAFQNGEIITAQTSGATATFNYQANTDLFDTSFNGPDIVGGPINNYQMPTLFRRYVDGKLYLEFGYALEHQIDDTWTFRFQRKNVPAISVVDSSNNPFLAFDECHNLTTGSNNCINTYYYGPYRETAQNSTILGGCNNRNYRSDNSSIIGGRTNNANFADSSSILGGRGNNLYGARCSAIIAGRNNSMYAKYSSIIGGKGSYMYYVNNSVILGGKYSYLSNSSGSIILGGNLATYETPYKGIQSGNRISGGMNNIVSGGFVASGGGPFLCNYPNIIFESRSSAVIGGYYNKLSNSKNSTILGSHGLSFSHYDNTLITGNELINWTESYTETSTNLVSTTSLDDATFIKTGSIITNISLTFSVSVIGAGLWGFDFYTANQFGIGDIIQDSITGATAAIVDFNMYHPYVDPYTYRYIITDQISNPGFDTTIGNPINNITIGGQVGYYNNSEDNYDLMRVNYNNIQGNTNSYLIISSYTSSVFSVGYFEFINQASIKLDFTNKTGHTIGDSWTYSIIPNSIKPFTIRDNNSNEIFWVTEKGDINSKNSSVNGNINSTIIASNGGYISSSYNSSIISGENNYIGSSCNSTILSSKLSCIKKSSINSSIIDSNGGYLSSTKNSTIFGGNCAAINGSYYGTREPNTIICGQNNILSGGLNYFNGGYCFNFSNKISSKYELFESNSNSIFGGYSNLIANSYYTIPNRHFTALYSPRDYGHSTIIGGSRNIISHHIQGFSQYTLSPGMHASTYKVNLYSYRTQPISSRSSIIGGYANQIYNNSLASIIGGRNNMINSYYGTHYGLYQNIYGSNGIFGGSNNTIFNYSIYNGSNNSIIGGNHNRIKNGFNSIISGGSYNKIYSGSSGILGGYGNQIGGYCSSIIGGSNNLLNATRSAIIGGSSLTSTFNDNVLVPTIMTADVGLSTASGVCWKLGNVKPGPVIFDGTNYISIELNGVQYKLALVK